jgi:hypothetical protein
MHTVTLSGNTSVTNYNNYYGGYLDLNGFTLTIENSIDGFATFAGTSTSNLVISGTGTNGTIYFVSGKQVLNNLVIDKPTGNVTLGSDLNVQGTLTLTGGIIKTGGYTLTLGISDAAPGTLVCPDISSSASFIDGIFKRLIPATGGIDVVFPVGQVSSYRPVILNFPTAPGNIAVTAQGFYTSPGSNNASYLDDGGYTIDRYSGDAGWEITPSTATSATYNISLGVFGITGASSSNFNKLRVLKRAGGGNEWVLDGTHLDGSGSQTNPIIKRTGLSGFSQFGIGGNASDGNTLNSPLPITLSSFSSSVNGKNVNLNWSTSQEVNNSGFNIERKEISKTSSAFEKIGFISGKGTVYTSTNYSFEDKNLNSGKYIYRLKQIDYNGNFESFDLNGEVSVTLPVKYELSQNYPNPFNPVTRINFDLPADSKLEIKVYDIAGREVACILNEFKKAGYHTVTFNASGFSSGVYFYRMKTNDFSITKKMTLIK